MTTVWEPICRKCGSALAADVRFCPQCGTPTPSYYSHSGVSPDDLTAASSSPGAPLQAPTAATDYGLPPYGGPLQNPYEPLNPYAIPLQAPPPPSPQRLGNRIGVIVGVVLLVLILVGGGVGMFAFLQYSAARNAAAAATATAQAVATATAPEQMYASLTSGTPVLDDPLSDNSKGNNWNAGTNAIGTCTFLGGAYHVIPSKGYFALCRPALLFFSDFAFQVQMKIIKGEAGGIGFRYSNGGYFFYITPEGSYTLFTSDPNGNMSTTLKNGLSLAIRTGLNQSNLIAVLAQGNTITLYVNNKYIGSVVNNISNKGSVGVSASAFVKPTEVVFSNAKVWTLP